MNIVVGGPIRVSAGNVVPLEDFLRFILPYAPGCADITATNAARSAIIQLCNATNVWEEEVGPVDVEKGVSTYSLAIPADASARQVTWAEFQESRLDLKPIDWLRHKYGNSRTWNRHVGSPIYATAPDKTSLTLVPTPDKTYVEALYYTIACTPTQDAETVPEQLIDYAAQIGAGALSLILIEPQRSYSNPTLATAMGNVFRAQISDIRIRKNQSYTNAPLQAQFKR